MNLRISDPRAHALAKRLAERRNVSVTDAVIEALEAELRRGTRQKPLAERLAKIADDLASTGHREGRDLSQAEIDAMWGCP